MAQDLFGKVTIVTGGAGGIGRATVERFVAEGAKVVIADVNSEEGEQFAAQMGPKAVFKRVDVSRRDEVQSLVDFAVDRFGTVDVMMNNAAIPGQTFSRFLDDELDDFDRVIQTNLFGVMTGSQFAARQMAKSGGGAIINISSIAGVLAGFGVVTYRASKAAVLQFSKSIAIDLAEYGIRVNSILPGHIRTNMSLLAPLEASTDVRERVKNSMDPVWNEHMPLKRVGKPDDVAEAALYFASDRSAQVTGAVLSVDGGITAGDPVNHMEKLMEARAGALVS